MNRNLIPVICKTLGIDIDEEFKINVYNDDIFRITKTGLEKQFIDEFDGSKWWEQLSSTIFTDLLAGNTEIIKLPWKPKVDETYYSFYYRQKDETWVVTGTLWDNDVVDNALFKAGWIFKTEDEAREALPSIATEAGAKYEQ